MKGRRRLKAVLILLALSPSLLMGGDLLVNGVSPARMRISGAYSTDGLSFAVVALYPRYAVAGSSLPVNVTLLVSIPGNNATVHVSSVYGEERSPTALNETNTQVLGWRLISVSTIKVNVNYTRTTKASWVVSVDALLPPTGFVDSFSPTYPVAFNGGVNMSVITGSGNQTTIQPVVLSILDMGPFYQSRLIQLRSPDSWVVSQLAALTVFVPALLLLRSREPLPSEVSYKLSLDAYMVEKVIQYLETLKSGGKVPDGIYGELKSRYEKKLATLKEGRQVQEA